MTDCFETCAEPAALTKPAIDRPAVNETSSAVVCVAVSGTAKLKPRALKSSEATLVDVDCTSVRSETNRSIPGIPTSARGSDGELEVGEAIQAVLHRRKAERDTRSGDADRARDDRLVIGGEAAADADEQATRP